MKNLKIQNQKKRPQKKRPPQNFKKNETKQKLTV